MAVTQKHRIFAVNTSLGEDVLLFWRMTATEQLGRLFELELELFSERTDIALADVLGKNMTVRMELPEVRGSGTRYFNGFVTRFSYQGMHGLSYGVYRATLSPWLWFLTRTSDCRIFQNRTAPDIIVAVFQEHGFSDFKISLSGNYRTWEYCVQYRETDFNFVSRLMEQEGIYYYFTHENGKHTLVLADNLGSHAPFPSYSQVPYYPPDTQNFRVLDHLYEWIAEKQVQPGTYELNDFDFTAPRKKLRTVASMPEDHAMANFAMYDYPGEYNQVSDGTHYSTVRLQELLVQHEVLRGEGIARGLAAGYLFSLTNCGREEQNRRYLVVSAVHQLQSDAYKSIAKLEVADKPYGVRITAIDAQQPYRAPRITRKPVVQGPQTAIVVGPSGEEIHTDQYGRVKCQFHWDRYGEANEKSSCWIRVAQGWAGKKWGALYLPRVGQEVIVEFLEGDPDQPIITGRVYNGVNMPPYTLPGYKTMSTLKSLSSTGGGGFNEFRFEDKKGEEQIFIHAQRRMDMRIRGSFYETNYGNREVRVGWEKDGNSGGDYNTFVQYNVNYHIKESEYQKIDKQFHQTIVEDVLESYKKNQTIFVTETSVLDAKKVIIVGADQVSAKSGKITLEGTQGVHIKAGQLNLEGQMGISLKVGGNFVVIDPSGVYINGMMVNINSGGSAQTAEAAEPVAEAEIEEPIDAAPADKAEPGQLSQISATPRTRKKVTLKPQEVPPYKAPPDKTAGTVQPPPPPPPKDDGKCALIEIKGWCQHQPSEREKCPEILEGKTVQVVRSSELLEGALGIDTDTLTIGPFERTFTNDRGSDEIKLEAKLRNEDQCRHAEGCPFSGKKVKWEITDNGIKYGDKVEFKAKGPIAVRNTYWLGDVTPKRYDVRCISCGSSKRLTIECYPANKTTVKVIISSEFTKRMKDIVDCINLLFEYAGLSNDDRAIKVIPPAGQMSAELGWKEYEDHRAFYAYVISGGFDPLIGLEGTARVGAELVLGFLLKIPVVGKIIQKNIIKYGVDAGIYFTLGGSLAASVRIERRSPDQKLFPTHVGGGLSGKIEVKVKIGVKIGPDGNVLSVMGGAVTAINAKGAFIFSKKGLDLEPSADFEGVMLGVDIELMEGKIKCNKSISLVAPKENIFDNKPINLLSFD